MATYIQKGNSIDYTNSGSTKIAAGDVVSLTTRIGIAAGDIAAGAVGSLAVGGVFEIAKATGDVTLGAAVYFDTTNKNITTTATSNIPAGWAVAAAASADTTVLVKIG